MQGASRYVAITVFWVVASLAMMVYPLISIAVAEDDVAPANGPAVAADAPASDDLDLLEEEFEDEFEEALEEGDSADFRDPIEPLNRGVFAFNRVFNNFLLIPISKAYGFIVPNPARHAIRRMFRNLNEPVVIVNDVLQLEWKDAGRSTTRLLFNTTIGVAGIWDAADYCLGIEHHDSDFGQTLAMAGAGGGPYFVIPILGPASARDGGGSIIDALMQPTTYLFGLGQLQILYSGSQGFSTLEEHADSLEALEESSVDFYSALRSAYSQQRKAEIWDRREHRRLSPPETPPAPPPE